MKWIELTNETQLNDLMKRSANTPQMIFKYSSWCGISDRIKDRLEAYPSPSGIEFYFLDIIAHRGLSNKIAALLEIHHESPQVLLIRNAECVYDESHNSIRMEEILQRAGVNQLEMGIRGLQ